MPIIYIYIYMYIYIYICMYIYIYIYVYIILDCNVSFIPLLFYQPLSFLEKKCTLPPFWGK